MHSYYKGECTLDSLSVAYFCVNGVVFNWCNYLLEELLVACEEAQEKGGTFTYGLPVSHIHNVEMDVTLRKTIVTCR
jgi:hypothetical protein